MHNKSKLSALKIMVNENNQALTDLRKYEKEHRNDFPTSAVYWAVVNEIKYLEQQNKELV